MTRTAWTAAELVDWHLPAPRWAVPELLAEGANLLVGPPKVGKSWLALNLAVSIAEGGRALGPPKSNRVTCCTWHWRTPGAD